MYKYFSILWILNSLPATAQIIPDQTLPVNSRTNLLGNTTQIEGGTSKGNNLFHSFSRFSVITGQIAAFNNAPSIQNIIGRVTGPTPSNINGLIKANGNTNLFLLNSNGILFGPNARLEIGGSFLASTAKSVRFDDGGEFTSSTSKATPLLSVSAPIGLSFGLQTGNIVVEGDGHRLRGTGGGPVTVFDTFGPGLEVKPGRTLGLVGGGITLDGAILSAKSGNLILGSVNQGYVGINQSNSGYTLNYLNSPTFNDITLTNRALLDASGLGNGSIRVQGKNIIIDKGAVSIIQDFGSFPSGDIRFSASRNLTISGTDPIARILSGIYSISLGTARGGDIRISTPNLILLEGGTVGSKTFGLAKAGDILLNISESTQISGVSPRTPSALSSINSLTGISNGRTGDIYLSTKDLSVTDGALLGTLSVSFGKGGNVVINASNGVFTSGVEESLLTPALITASAFREGDAGSVSINTKKLIVRDGGRVDSSTTFSGSAGKVTINASELVEVTGTVPGSKNPSLITSSANVLDDSLLNTFSIFTPVGASGDVVIRTKNLLVKDGGRISVQNDGPNDAGQLNILADRINLKRQGTLSARSTGVNGGSIQILSNSLILNNSSITATTDGNGTGGNIDITTKLFVGFAENDISANAINKRGGNIRINSQGLFLSPDTRITATSKAGPQLNGTVTIDTQRTGAEETTTPVPDLEIAPQIASACNPSTGTSKFIAMGPGALEMEPSQSVSTDLILDTFSTPITYNPQVDEALIESPIVEATGWKNDKGKLILTSDKQANSTHLSANSETCNKT
ncbi:two-partner secretion domain-containing protein [Acaryochloris marina NIES-2412]|uniref:two-partner secretion domain-containing protein n=1 Tax=Acaryochloris marina TaxID=155978 RepID=UPI0040586415